MRVAVACCDDVPGAARAPLMSRGGLRQKNFWRRTGRVRARLRWASARDMMEVAVCGMS